MFAGRSKWLSPQGCRAEIKVRETRPALPIGTAADLELLVRNQGNETWPHQGDFPVHVSYHWLNDRSQTFVFEGMRSALTADLSPGQEALVQCSVLTPNTPGRYLLEFDMVQEFVRWFKDAGSPTTKVPCTVTGKKLEDFGTYEKVWRKADLNKDYWSVVGPGSLEEFVSLGQQKLNTLISLGFGPASSVLDIGCGTGCLTRPLLEYLGPSGRYLGTDLAGEAVAFCRARYRRPNFHFLKNTMTSLPISGERFDFIVFFSVFTHTFPQETAALLRESKRLLKRGGLILADAFLRRGGDAFSGSRSKVEVNEEHFHQLVAASGLEVEPLYGSPWEESVQRVFLRLQDAEDL